MAGYFTQYVYMPKVTNPKVVVDAIGRLDEVLHPDIDGFAYADAYDDGRYVGLTLSAPSEVRQNGLIVDPLVAREQLAEDFSAAKNAEAVSAGGAAGAKSSSGEDGPSGSLGTGSRGTATTVVSVKQVTRFHATKELSSARVVRDVSQIYEEIISHFVSAGVDVKVTLDVESDKLGELTDDQRIAIRENLKALGFGNEDWSME